MKKPKKPGRRHRGPRKRAGARSELGPAALAFLARGTKPKARTWPGGVMGMPGVAALGPAAQGFVRRARLARFASPSVGSLSGLGDQRETLALLVMPALMLAFALGMSHTWTHPTRLANLEQILPRMAVTETAPATLALGPLPPEVAPMPPSVAMASPAPPLTPQPFMPAPPTLDTENLLPPSSAAPNGVPEADIFVPAPHLPTEAPQNDNPDPQSHATLVPDQPSLPPLALAPPPPSAEAASVCHAKPGFGLHSYVALPLQSGESMGERLAAAARAQTAEFVIYNAKYRSMAYPMGDVAPLFGVCTDVVIRAYRTLGIDLQELVRRAGVGSGDTNIDHRRTETLRRLFARRGEELPITTFPEDYQPGDIVTYHRPQNRRTQSHIAIVSDVIAPSGRPMIVHNRGWGPQLEDALFVDRITGHYRYRPESPIVEVATAGRKPSTAQSRPPRTEAMQTAVATLPTLQ